MNVDLIVTAFSRIASRIRRLEYPDDDSNDALQDAFCRLWRRGYNFKDASHAEKTLNKTLRNIQTDNLRRQAVHPTSELNENGDFTADTRQEEIDELYGEVSKIINTVLSERDRQILFLRDRDEWEFDEIALKFSISEANVRMIVSRARKTVREVYMKYR